MIAIPGARLAIVLRNALLAAVAAAAPALDLSQWHLTFDDEFNGSAVNWSTWSLGNPWGALTPGDTQAYLADDCIEGNGVLRLKGERRAYSGYSYTSGAVHTDGHYTQLYGYFEMRAKIPKGQGIWPAFWLLNHWGNPELDVMEVLGDQPNKVYMTQHYSGGQTQGSYIGPDYSLDYHTYGLEWNSGAVIWYIDGVERFRSTTNVPQVALELIVTLQVGGDWPGMPDSTTPFPANMDVDYVRAYQPSASPTPSPTPTPSTNQKPVISWVTPTGSTSYLPPATIHLTNAVSDSDGTIAKVEYRANGTLFHTENFAPYDFDWANVAAGSYTVVARAYDNQGATTDSSPITVLVGSGGGLRATYFDNSDFTGTSVSRTDATLNFNWGSGSPSSAIGVDTFSARWTGYVLAPTSETYTFTTRSDDGIRVWVNGTKIIDNWTLHAATDNSGAIALQANKRYAITVEYFENGGQAVAQLSWATPTRVRAIVPQAYLFGSATTAGESEIATSSDAGSGGRCGIGAGLAVALALMLGTRRLRSRC